MKRTMRKLGRCACLLLMGLWMMYVYYNTIFKVVPQLSLQQSRRLLWGLFWGWTAVSMYISWVGRHNILQALLSTFVPVGIYTMIAYYPLYRLNILILLGILVALGTGYVILTLLLWRRQASTGRMLRTMAPRLRSLVGVVMACMVIVTFSVRAYGGGVMQSHVTAVRDDSGLEEQQAMLLKLDERVWIGLRASEKLDVLQVVANLEASALGLAHELNVQADNMDDARVLAHYREHMHQISINGDHLEEASSMEMLEAILHESYHAYEHQLVRLYETLDPDMQQLYTFQRVAVYRAEFASYVDGTEDMQRYSQQLVEQDSQKYARSAIKAYQRLVYPGGEMRDWSELAAAMGD